MMAPITTPASSQAVAQNTTWPSENVQWWWNQIASLRRLRAERDGRAVQEALGRLEEAARGAENLMYPLKDALAAYATIGECCDRLRDVFGEYQPPDISQ